MSREPLLPSPLPQGSDLRDPTFLLTIPLAGWALGPSKPPLQNLDTALGAPEGRENKRTKVNGSVSSSPRLGAPQMHTHTLHSKRTVALTHTQTSFTPRNTHTHTHTLFTPRDTHTPFIPRETHPSFQGKHTHTHPSLQGNSRPHSQPLFLKPLF